MYIEILIENSISIHQIKIMIKDMNYFLYLVNTTDENGKVSFMDRSEKVNLTKPINK
jgi:hypothetical protein